MSAALDGLGSFSGQRFRDGGVVHTIWRLAGDRRGVLARSIGHKALQAAFQALPVGILVAVIGALRQGTLDVAALGWATLGLAGCVVGQWVAGFAANRSAWIATFELFGDLRVRGIAHLRRLPLSFHEDRPVGDTVTAMTQDIASVEQFAHEPLQQLIGAMAAPLVVFLVLLVQDVPMAVATMVSIVLSLPIFVWTNRVFRQLAAERQELQAEASSRMIEYVQGLPVIRAFRLTGERLTLLRAALDDYRAINTRLAVRLAPLGLSFMATVLLGIPCVLFFATLWLANGTIDAGTFLVFAVLTLRVFQPLVAAAESFESLRIADASLDRVAHVFDTPVQAEPDRETSLGSEMDVAFDGVSFAYGADGPVLEDVSFVARSGRMTAIVGPSGSGKSTLLQLVARFREPQQGAVRIAGIELRDLTTEQIFDAVTFVFQDVYLFPGTIWDNIAIGRPDARFEDVVEAAKAAQAHAFIEALPDGYETPVGEAGARLSGGERQRISVARAILKDAPIVLLDEATAALDPTNERQLQEALSALVRDKTLIVVAHRLSTIRAADQILVLEEGRIVERGRHEELLGQGGRYRRLWSQRERASRWRLRSADDPPAG
ncbi:MAG: ABC transporter ATP-binding protein [Myxococcota bacterium]